MNGKGSARRPRFVPIHTWNKNYDRIFKKKDFSKEKNLVESINNKEFEIKIEGKLENE